MVSALIEPFGQASHSYFYCFSVGGEGGRGTVFAKWSPRGGRVIFAPKSPCARCGYVGRAREKRAGKYLECPQHLSKRRKEGKKHLSHIDGGEWAAITETASFGVLVRRRRRAMRARAADVKLPSYQIFPALLFSSKNGLRDPPPSSFSHERRAAPQ